MTWKYTLCTPDLGEEEEAAVLEVIRGKWLSMGPRTETFEQRFRDTHGCSHAFAVANGTAALHLALLALGIGEHPDDEVIQPAINFVAAANTTRAVGARPVFADIVSPTEPTIDPEQVLRLITPRTRAVMAMHYGGYPAQMQALLEICRQHGLALIEDACHGVGYLPPEFPGRGLGGIGDIGCFSFFPNKNMTTGEGGMVTTGRDDLAERVRLLRSHGMTSLTWERHQGPSLGYDVARVGFNYRIDEIRSALGLVQLEKLPENNRLRQQLAGQYGAMIRQLAIPGLEYVFGHCPEQGAAHLAAVLVPEARRGAVVAALHRAGIQCSLHYPLITGFSGYGQYREQSARTPRAGEFASRVLTLPIYPGLTGSAVEEIVQVVAEHCRGE